MQMNVMDFSRRGIIIAIDVPAAGKAAA